MPRNIYLKDVLKIFALALFFPLLPTATSAQEVKTIKEGCILPQADEDAGDANGRRVRRQLPTINSQWDPTRIYRQAVILVSFSDTDFKMDKPRETYDSIFNCPGYNLRKGPSCVADYFREQSGGKFNLQFDVYGPIKVSELAQPFANPTSNTRNYGREVFTEAVEIVIDSLGVDFSVYDWNGNNSVNQIIFVYAGLTGNQSVAQCYGHIWPNTSTFSTIKANGVKISNYTASAELWYNGMSCGIGTICHEFTHSLGLPDIYPTSDKAGYSTVDEWDLMDGGNFTNYGWCPPNFTPMEKMLLGWMDFTELDEPTSVVGLKTVSEGGEVYRIKHSDNEWLLLENRQQKGWDLGTPGKGLVVYHVLYEKSSWSGNTVNNNVNCRRFELIPADNRNYDAWTAYINSWLTPKNYANSGLMNNYHFSTAPYPWIDNATETANDSLTNYSVPAAKMHYANLQGDIFLSKPITNIVQNDDGTISFDFMGGGRVKGDVNADRKVDVADIGALIEVIARGGTESQVERADVNGDGALDVADISAVLSIMAGRE